MNTDLAFHQRTLLRGYLLAAYVLLILYASLSPFSGWQEQGLAFWDVLVSPLVQTYNSFDALSNLLAYIPLGLLLALTWATRFSAGGSLLLTLCCAVMLSAGLEYVQMYLPNRTSSNADILSNGLGALAGAILAALLANRAWFVRITQWRIELFQRGAAVDFGLTLVMLWMFAQINPSLPMLGNVFITEAAHRIFVTMPEEPFSLWESAAVALNLLMVGMLLQTLMRARRHSVVALMSILSVVALAKFVAAAVLLKSWALLLWLNSEAMLGIVVGLLLMWATNWLPRMYLLWTAALVALGYLVLALWVLDSGTPTAAMRLYQWLMGLLLE